MDNDILFTEKQQFRQWWLWLILLIANSLFITGIIWQIILDEEPENRIMSTPGLLISAMISILITILIKDIRLETIIKTNGIYVRFYPFHFRFRYYAWHTLTKSYVREYFPIAEYGGWGIRFSLAGKGMAFNISGNKGLQLKFTNNKKLLIGTNKPEELTTILYRIGQLKQ